MTALSAAMQRPILRTLISAIRMLLIFRDMKHLALMPEYKLRQLAVSYEGGGTGDYGNERCA